jgi:sigma-B regulation protein RsbU (phosphoserine phosphatase)
MRSRDASALVGAHAAPEAHDHVGWALGHLLKSGVHLTNSRSAAFFLLSPDTNRLALRAAQHLDATSVPHPARELIASTPDLRALARQPVRFVAESDEPHEWLPSGCRSGLCVPVQSDKTPLGTLWMFNRRTHAYSHREEQVAAAIAVQIAGILERVTPPRDSDTWKRIEREVRIAAQGQGQWQLSRSSLPNDSRCEIAARCENCFELGGDLCELFALNADRLTIAIGDASGNSIPAAMIMAAVRGAVRTHVPPDSDLAGLISHMNRMLCEVTRSHQFMSLFYGVLDLHRRRLTYVNAGHPNPILFRQRQPIPLESHGMLLGVIKEAPYQAATVDVQPHDLLVLYSDGISETRDATRRMFRAAGIIEAVQKCVSPVADDVLHAIWTSASAHSDRAAQPDDRTVTVLRVLDR